MDGEELAEAKSSPDTFVIHTKAPTVTLEAVKSPAKDETPTFKGTASDGTPVTVEVFAGAKAEGTPVRMLKATPSGTHWEATVTEALGEGTYTAVAGEPSIVEFPEAESAPDAFVIHTKAPTVSLEAVKSPSKNEKPVFKGSASDGTPVFVRVYNCLLYTSDAADE